MDSHDARQLPPPLSTDAKQQLLSNDGEAVVPVPQHLELADSHHDHGGRGIRRAMLSGFLLHPTSGQLKENSRFCSDYTFCNQQMSHKNVIFP
uniref:Uncharacterized protein n=2 Tax=Oryza punctata TaxID=4537 RepID=A0A0E0JMM9_ORYPU